MNTREWILSIVAVILVIIIGLGIGLYRHVYISVDYTILNGQQKMLTKSIAEKWQKKIDSIPEDQQNKVKLSELKAELNYFEQLFVDRILSIPGKDLGFKAPYMGIDEPSELVLMPNKIFSVPNTTKVYETGAQYYPKAAAEDFGKMVTQMKSDIGKEIWNDSGYRSPGKQAYLFFKYLADETEDGNKYSLLENAKWIALPGYSEHGSSKTPAFDFAVEGGDSMFLKADGKKMSNEEQQTFFENTAEFKWMQAHAQDYHFYLSYPKNNPTGVSYEPWHWKWEKN